MAPFVHEPLLPNPTIDLHWNEWRGAIHEVFVSNAQKTPEATCVIETAGPRNPERIFTYRQINESSNQLAHHLLAHGCERGDVIMIYAHRGVDLVVTYMGVLKAGAAICVLDPQYPFDRQKVLLDVARPRFLIYIERATQEAGKPSGDVIDFIRNGLSIKAEISSLKLGDDGVLRGGEVNGQDCLQFQLHLKSQAPKILIGPDSIPTLSFTSGSEGRPKGVQGRHFSLTHYFPWMAQKFRLSRDDRFAMLSGIAHDPIQRDIFTPLFLGAQIVIPPVELISHQLLAEWMQANEITVTHLTPAMGQILVGGAVAVFSSLHHVFFVGDLLTKKDCRRLQDLAPRAVIVNMYGTTETQRAVSFFEIPSKAHEPQYLEENCPDVIPVGQGMVNVQLLVVDRMNCYRTCSVGEEGELYLRAGGLSNGYIGDNAEARGLNESKFLNNWFVETDKWTHEYEKIASITPQPWMAIYSGPRDRIYRTGDLGRFREDGAVECTGRIDNQVKIRGFRIELGEIDTQLSHHPFVRENITMVRRNQNEEPTLVSYIVPEAKRWFEEKGVDDIAQDIAINDSIISMLQRFKSLCEDCRAFLKKVVPHYAVPSIIIPLTSMPLNPNGKIDKPALPFPTADDFALSNRRIQSGKSLTQTQKKLATIWATVLPDHLGQVFEPESNFFENGGHSIVAQHMLHKVNQEWKDLHIPMSAVFRHQTLGAFAAVIDAAQHRNNMPLNELNIEDSSSLSRGFDDEAYAADADDLVKELPQAIGRADTTHDSSPCTVLLTGATGFLGSYILADIMNMGMNVVAHVRSKDASTGLERIESISKAYGLWSEDWKARLRVVIGDISQPELGLSREDWDYLTEIADVIVHNGAQVNWMRPYTSLRAANVLSTMHCITLCARGRSKQLAFVSSTSALDTEYYVKLSQDSIATGASGILETDDLEGSRTGLGTGYGQSKWVSEYIIREAGRRGLRGAVIRPGYIMGDPNSGISITDDYLVRLWKGCLQVRGRPDLDTTINQVPVTQVSRLVVASALRPPVDPLGVVQVTSHPRLTLNQWLGSLEVYGYDVPQISYGKWCSQLREYVENDHNEELAILPLLHFVTGDLPADSIAPELDDRNAAVVLGEQNALRDNAVGMETVGKYLSFLASVGFLPSPLAKEGAMRLPDLEFSVDKFKALAGLGGRR